MRAATPRTLINNAMVATLLGEIASSIRWRALVLRALRERRDA